MTQTLTLQLSWPSPDLSPNGRLHWAAKARTVRAARREAFFSLMSVLLKKRLLKALKGQKMPVNVHFVMFPPAAYRYDDDNLFARLKPYRDGLADACGLDDFLFKQTVEVGETTVPGGAVHVTLSFEGLGGGENPQGVSNAYEKTTCE